LGPAKPMTQSYFEFCSIQGLGIVGSWRAQVPHVCWGAPNFQSDNPSAPCVQGSVQPTNKSPSATCVPGVPNTEAGTGQAPCVCRGCAQPPGRSPSVMCPHVVFLL